MVDVLRIKRRAVGGASGPPVTLAAAEIAFNEQDRTLYYGLGNSGGLATSIIAIAGDVKANLASPVFTGTPSLPTGTIGVTQAPATSDTTLATTAFVTSAVSTGVGAYLPLTGGALSGGLGFGSAVAAAATNVTRHIALYGTTFGFSITSNRINYVVPSAASHKLMAGAIEALTVSTAGIGIGGSISGTVTLAVPATAGTNTITFPAGTTNFSATGGTRQVVKQLTTGGAFTVATLTSAELDNTQQLPTLLGTAAMAAAVRGVVVMGNYAYTTNQHTTATLDVLEIFDITTATAPLKVGGLPLPNQGLGNPVIAGHILYTGCNLAASGLQIIDISNPKAPSVLRSFNAGAVVQFLALSGIYLYVGYGTTNTAFRIYDVSDPANPVQRGNVVMPGASGTRTIVLQGKYAFVGTGQAVAGTGGLYIYDVSDPALPVLVPVVFNPAVAVSGLAVVGKYLYIAGATAANGLQVVNIEDPANPVSVAILPITGIPNIGANPIVAGNYLFMTTNNANGLQVINISDPAAPSVAWSVSTVLSAVGSALRGERLYITANAQLRIYDTQGIDIPTLRTGSINTDLIYVDGQSNFNGDIFAQRSLVVGQSGILSRGPISAATPAAGDNSNRVATTAFVKNYSITVSDTPPAAPVVGTGWFDSTAAQLYIWFNDGTSSQWVAASNQPGAPGLPGATGPQGPAGGTGVAGPPWQVGSGLSLNTTTDPDTVYLTTPALAQSGGTLAGGLTIVGNGGATDFSTLNIDTAVGITAGKFGALVPIYLTASFPTIGFNAFFNSPNWVFGKGSAAGSHYASRLMLDSFSGYFNFSVSTATGAANAVATFDSVLAVDRNGYLLIGKNAAYTNNFPLLQAGTGGSLNVVLGDGSGYGPVSTSHLTVFGHTSGATARAYRVYASPTDGEWAYMGDWSTTPGATVARYGTDKNGTGIIRGFQFLGGGTNVLDWGVSTASSWTMPAAFKISNNTGATEGVVLNVDAAVSIAVAKFGSSLPFYIHQSQPILGFNTYWSGSAWVFGKGSAAGLNYSGTHVYDTPSGLHILQSTTATGAANAPATLQNVFAVNRNGIVTLGPFADFTALFPALKRNATTLEVRLANDTAYAPLTASFVTAAGGIVGTATNDNAAAGRVGEFISSELLSGSAVPMVTTTWLNVTSIILTAGDWDVWASVGFAFAVGASSSNCQAQISTTSLGGMTPPNGGGFLIFQSAITAGAAPMFAGMRRRVSIASSTTVYLCAVSVFAGGACNAYGGIYARRRR